MTVRRATREISPRAGSRAAAGHGRAAEGAGTGWRAAIAAPREGYAAGPGARHATGGSRRTCNRHRRVGVRAGPARQSSRPRVNRRRETSPWRRAETPPRRDGVDGAGSHSENDRKESARHGELDGSRRGRRSPESRDACRRRRERERRRSDDAKREDRGRDGELDARTTRHESGKNGQRAPTRGRPAPRETTRRREVRDGVAPGGKGRQPRRPAAVRGRRATREPWHGGDRTGQPGEQAWQQQAGRSATAAWAPAGGAPHAGRRYATLAEDGAGPARQSSRPSAKSWRATSPWRAATGSHGAQACKAPARSMNRSAATAPDTRNAAAAATKTTHAQVKLVEPVLASRVKRGDTDLGQ